MIKNIFVFLLVIALSGCAGSQVKREGKDKLVYEGNDRVYAAIKKLLQQGAAVNLMLDYAGSSSGLPEGHGPEDFGCETNRDVILDTEKLLLLDAFSEYPNFLIIDRSKLDRTVNEINLGMKGVTSSAIEPGQVSGATHLLIIEEKNNFVRQDGDMKDNYIEIKKLLDMKKGTVLAVNKYSESKFVQYKPVITEPEPESKPEETEGGHYSYPAIPNPPGASASQPMQQQPSVTPKSNLKEHEVIRIYGAPSSEENEQQQEPAYTAPPPVQYSAPAYQSGQPAQIPQYRQGIQPVQGYQAAPMQRIQPISGIDSTQPVHRLIEPGTLTVPPSAQQPSNQIQDWQLARILKQRYPGMRNQDNTSVIRHFIQRHPDFRDRVTIIEKR